MGCQDNCIFQEDGYTEENHFLFSYSIIFSKNITLKWIHMLRHILFLYSFLLCLSLQAINLEESIAVSYNGRFRPAEAYARLQLYEWYHAQQFKGEDWPAPSALAFLWQLHFHGGKPFQDLPLFWLGSAELKESLQLDPIQMRSSYHVLHQQLYENPETSLFLIQRLISYHFFKTYFDSSNRPQSKWLELKSLTPGLWVQWQHDRLHIVDLPSHFPWKGLSKGDSWSIQNPSEWVKSKKWAEEILTLMNILQRVDALTGAILSQEQAFESLFNTLKKQSLSSKEIALQLDKHYPLTDRLKAAGSLWKILPGRYHSGEWFSPHAFNVRIYSPHEDRLIPVSNFTLFSNEEFEALRNAYLTWEQATLKSNDLHNQEKLQHQFFTLLNQAYQQMAGHVYQEATGKTLSYPTVWQLKLETLYYQLPFLSTLIGLYGLASLLLILAYQLPTPLLIKLSLINVGLAFILHTLMLLCRCLILGRPPVSNMFETVLYVPWVAVLTSRFMLKQKEARWISLLSATVASFLLLIILQVTDLNHHLDQVQAVLDSQFWLIIHVLMVVGSYGIFILAGILGHFYLISYFYYHQEMSTMRTIAQTILQSFYIGTTLLITGTLLGGVWAAESWGRFWDWDPKESWAFISSCIYLIWIHAYRFQKIQHIGLAIGSITGLAAISFTWYGVNYILGTGFHSYGFGAGGEIYYYIFLIIEACLLTLFTLFYYYSIKRVHTRKLKNISS